MMLYEEIPPPRALVRHIECIWSLTPSGGSNVVERVYPDGASDIVVVDGRVSVHGPAASVRLTSPAGPTVGFRIRNGAVKSLLGVSPTEILDGPVAFASVWRGAGREVGANLTKSDAARRLVDVLATRAAEAAPRDAVVLAALAHLDRAPHVGVSRIAREIGVSERHLRRRFECEVGLGLKLYARLTRFQALLDATRVHKRRAVPPCWAGLAHDHGFSDQAHLIREVRAFADLTPDGLLRTV